MVTSELAPYSESSAVRRRTYVPAVLKLAVVLAEARVSWPFLPWCAGRTGGAGDHGRGDHPRGGDGGEQTTSVLRGHGGHLCSGGILLGPMEGV